METDDVSDIVEAIRSDVVNELISDYITPGSMDDQWDIAGLEEALQREYAFELPVQRWLDEDDQLHEETLRDRVLETMVSAYREKEDLAGTPVVRHFEKAVMLQVLDTSWKEHLAAMDYLRQGIGLRGYAQKDPKQEYKKEAFAMFEAMLDRIKHEVISILTKVQVRAESDVEAVEEQRRRHAEMDFKHDEAGAMGEASAGEPAQPEQQQPFTRTGRKVGRNEPCPCGSGKKYKHCHGKLS
jgi:preprotein translocase subunit SecA